MPERKTIRPQGERSGKESEDRQMCCHGHRQHSSFWGVVLVVIGFFWLARSLGWLDEIDIPWVPVFMILAGVYFIFRSQYPPHSEKKDNRPS